MVKVIYRTTDTGKRWQLCDYYETMALARLAKRALRIRHGDKLTDCRALTMRP